MCFTSVALSPWLLPSLTSLECRWVSGSMMLSSVASTNWPNGQTSSDANNRIDSILNWINRCAQWSRRLERTERTDRAKGELFAHAIMLAMSGRQIESPYRCSIVIASLSFIAYPLFTWHRILNFISNFYAISNACVDCGPALVPICILLFIVYEHRILYDLHGYPKSECSALVFALLSCAVFAVHCALCSVCAVTAVHLIFSSESSVDHCSPLWAVVSSGSTIVDVVNANMLCDISIISRAHKSRYFIIYNMRSHCRRCRQ